MATPIIRKVNLTASALVKDGACKLYGFVVNSHTTGTLKLWDSTTAANDVIFNTITLPAAPYYIISDAGIACSKGIFATIGGAAADITILYGELDR